MSGSTGGFGDWFSNLFGSSSASAGNAAGLGFNNSDTAWAEMGAQPGEGAPFGPLSSQQLATARAGAGVGAPGDQTALGMDAKQWATAAKLLGGSGQGAGGQQAAAQQQQQQQRGAGQGLHPGNPSAFNGLLTQILQRRAASTPGAAMAPPPGLMGASRG
jgi:hypothetical protein